MLLCTAESLDIARANALELATVAKAERAYDRAAKAGNHKAAWKAADRAADAFRALGRHDDAAEWAALAQAAYCASVER